MPKNAPPRLARFDRVRNSGSGHPVIMATITAGPRSEIGKTVVDLARWEHTETPNEDFSPDDINSEWKRI